MQENVRPVVLDPKTRSICAHGQQTRLQEKTWRVLRLLTAEPGTVVSRDDLIADAWDDNYPVGNKGLNQALWTIRTALGDDARNPTYIRTIPRVGYQWVHAAPIVRTGRVVGTRRTAAVAASVFTALVLSLAFKNGNVESAAVAPSAQESVADDGSRAYLSGRSIIVEQPAGCRRIVKAESPDMHIGNPVLSADGSQLFFPVTKNGACRLVTLDVENGERTDFGSCPAWLSS